MKKYIIVGANGFIGSSLVEELAKKNFVIAVDRYSTPPQFKVKGNIEVVKLDVNKNFKELEKLGKREVSGIVWAVGGAIPADSIKKKSDIRGPLEALVSLTKIPMGKGVPIILTSSAGMLYRPKKSKLTEKSQVEPWTDYGKQKKELEKELLNLSKNLPRNNLKILRISSVYGERQPVNRDQGVVAKLILSALQKQPFILYGSDSARRDYIYVKDLAKIIHQLLNKKASFQIINVSTGQGTTLKNLVLMIEKISKSKIMISHQEKRQIDPNHIDVSNSLLLDELTSFKFSPLEEGLTQVINWYKKNL
ncbi:MAG TPA: NAD-dependent epimerase/dehydratase family protein [Candidatus Saccharimonadales bacterium]|nr:NAD-dependent epimerase/dehydratase family protein [Candidatus Saccharimonadales bacterium]